MTEIVRRDDNGDGDYFVVLHGVPVSLDSEIGRAFIEDNCRIAEQLFKPDDVLTHYGISTEAWQRLGENEAFRKAIFDARERRIRCNIAAQEAAARLHVGAQAVLGSILHDQYVSPRARIAAAQEIRQTAVSADTEGTRDTGEKFIIHIDLSGGGGEVLHYEFDKAPVIEQAPGEENPDE